MKRRQALIGGVAGLSLIGGVGAGWWWNSGTNPNPLPADFWSMRFEQPQGGELVLQSMRGQKLLLNFWATWCAPCVTEMPLLDQFHRDQRADGWQVVGLAIDGPTPVRSFLAQRPVGFAIGLAGIGGVELARALGNPSGSLPYSVVINRSGMAVQSKLGALHASDLKDWAASTG